MAGFRKFFDKVTEWEWFRTPFMFHLFAYLILKANYKDEETRGIMVKRGQILTSLREISEETGISIRTIRTCLARLEATNELTSKPTNKFRIITICKFDDYQGLQDDDRQANRQANRQTNDSFPSSPTPLLSISNNIDDIDITLSNAHVREDDSPLFYVSSVMKDYFRGNPDGLVAEKIRRVRERLSKIAPSVGMDESEQEKFIRYWCEHDDGSTTLRAEKEEVFNLRERAKRWMEKPSRKQGGTLYERNRATVRKLNALFDERDTTVPDEQ